MNVEDTIRDSLNDALAVPGHLDIDPAAGQLIRTAALRHRRNRRVTMASSLGAVVAVVAGIVVWSTGVYSGNGKPVVPATPQPVMSPSVTPSPSTGPSTSPSTSPSGTGTTPPASTSASSTPPAQTISVTVGDTQLMIPSGWAAEQILPQGGSSTILPSWCIMPASDPAPTAANSSSCPIVWSAAATGGTLSGFSVDNPGGLIGNPEFCSPGDMTTDQLLDYQDRQLGDRPADFRQWLFVCTDGTRWPVEQYIADNYPGYILYSDHADASVHAVMADIAETAKLPAATSSLRLSDFGILRSVTAQSGGYHVTLDRVIRGIPDLINNNPATYAYDIPTSVLLAGQIPKVGDRVELNTNGTTGGYFVIDQ
jgi:hypothetical protein